MSIHSNGTLVEGSVGTTLSTREMNGYHDSDFLASYWSGEEVVEVLYDSTRFGGSGSASIDATEEVLQFVAAYKSKIREEREAKKAKCIAESDATLQAFLVNELGAREENARKLLAAITEQDWKHTANGDCGFSFSYDVREANVRTDVAQLTSTFNNFGCRFFKLLMGNLRSSFKISMRDQVIAWLKAENPKYEFPLSYKQKDYV